MSPGVTSRGACHGVPFVPGVRCAAKRLFGGDPPHTKFRTVTSVSWRTMRSPAQKKS
ncbi:hypothetical protein GFS60_04543 [Rhodococcus sp. WAY2]|nr:hypothetical protein GFS60_04543 [Rhodococcus sp. WAY2]